MTVCQIEDPAQVKEDTKQVGRIARLPLSAYDEKRIRRYLDAESFVPSWVHALHL